MHGTSRVDRISPTDLAQLVTDVGPVPMNVGALLVLAGADARAGAALAAALARRLAGIPRLRQRLVTPGVGLGRPYWIDDVAFDVDAHVRAVRCPGPGTREQLLAVATEAVTKPLPRSRPLWRAVLVTGLERGEVGVVVVLHHVLADGVGSLAVLRRLAEDEQAGDGRSLSHPTAPSAGTGAPEGSPQPSAGRLFVDSARDHLAALGRAPAGALRLARGVVELDLRPGRRAPRCSLNVPTGPKRALHTVTVDLADLHAAAQRVGATINDALLVVVTGAMARVLRDRGEDPGELVVSVPISGRTSATTTELGNRVGVMPVRVPTGGPAADRLRLVGRLTRRQKRSRRGDSVALTGPAFRLLAALGLLRAAVDHQRAVNTFLTNLVGPRDGLTIGGATVAEIVPITLTQGNVAMAFAALSYAGRLTIVVSLDPRAVVEDPEDVLAALRAELQAVLQA